MLYFIWTVGGQIDGGCMAYCEIMCALPDLSMVNFKIYLNTNKKTYHDRMHDNYEIRFAKYHDRMHGNYEIRFANYLKRYCEVCALGCKL